MLNMDSGCMNVGRPVKGLFATLNPPGTMPPPIDLTAPVMRTAIISHMALKMVIGKSYGRKTSPALGLPAHITVSRGASCAPIACSASCHIAHASCLRSWRLLSMFRCTAMKLLHATLIVLG